MMVVLIGLGDGGMVLGRQWASISISAMMAVFVCVCVLILSVVEKDLSCHI